jgi:molybdopterin converting factor small subunit
MADTPSYQVDLSGNLAIQAGRSRLHLAGPPGSTLVAGDLRKLAAAEVPELAPLIEGSLVVADDRILGSAEPVPQSARLSLVPPVSGG